jgi:hypothetical protein
LVVFDVTGTGFPPGEIVALRIDNSNAFCDIPEHTPRVDANGGITRNCQISAPPFMSLGTHQLCADSGWAAQPIKVVTCATFSSESVMWPSSSDSPPSPSPTPASLVIVARPAGGSILAAWLPGSLAVLGTAIVVGLAWFVIRMALRRRRLRP